MEKIYFVSRPQVPIIIIYSMEREYNRILSYIITSIKKSG